MPQAPLYPAPSHVPASSVPLDTTVLSNGNHLSSAPLSELTTSAPNTATIGRLLYTQSRKSSSKLAPIMGSTESKPSDAKLNALFDHYKDTDDDILAEGCIQLCKDLSLPPEDFKVLVFAWKLKAEQMCRFTRSEFVNGFKSIRVDSIKGVQTRLPEIVTEIEQNYELFKDLYRFSFKYGLDAQGGQRILPTNMAILLWRLVFTLHEPPILNRWLNFLETHPQVRGIPKDTWNMFLNFADHVGEDLSCYDDNEAWPSLFDDFVEYENDQANQNISKEKDCEDLLITKE